MVTRNVPLDVELIPAVVKQPAAYIGLMGSAQMVDNEETSH